MTRKPRIPRPQMSEYFIFEIADFETDYMLSVNRQRDDDAPWWEHASVVLQTICVHPKKVASRPARFDIVATRDFWAPFEWRRDHNWRPDVSVYLSCRQRTDASTHPSRTTA
jgi:hypothetical protein